MGDTSNEYRNKKTGLSLVLVLGLLPMSASADEGVFIGASVGSATLTDDFDGFDVDADSTAYRLVFGYQFSDMFALEAGYHRFGTFEEDQGFRFQLDADGVFVGGQPGRTDERQLQAIRSRRRVSSGTATP